MADPHTHTRETVPLTIRIVREERFPNGIGILMQFEHGFLVMNPRDALKVTDGLLLAVAEIEEMGRRGGS